MTILWCVGCGDIGSGVGQALAQTGWRAVGLRRTPPSNAPFEQIAVDVLADPEHLKTLPVPDYVVYTVTPSQRTEQAYSAAYDAGVRNVLSALPASLKRFILISSTAVYHQKTGEWVDETSPTRPESFSGKALLAGEQHAHDCGLPYTVVRLSGIYGPGRNRLIERARAGAPAVKNPPLYTNRIHRDDAVGFIVYLLQESHAGMALENLYLGTDDDPATEWEVMTAVAEMMGVPPPEEKTGEGDQNKRCRNVRLKASGYLLKYSGFREGYSEMIANLLNSREA